MTEVTKRQGVIKGQLTYTHKAMMDLVLANPTMSLKDLAEYFGVTEAWAKKVTMSDAFQAVLDKRREEIINPIISESVTEKIRGLTNNTLDMLNSRVELGIVKTPELIEIAKMGLTSQGLLDTSDKVVNNNQFVVAMPNKVATSDEWAEIVKPDLKEVGV
jgi:hypothetical protein